MNDRSHQLLTGAPAKLRRGRSLAAIARMYLLAGLSLTLLSLIGCERQQGSQAPATRPAAPVNVTAAVSEDVPLYIEQIGKTVAREYVTVQPQVSGQIKEISFIDGEDVTHGKVLFTIDPRPFEAALAQAQANLAQREAELELAQQEFARVSSLITTKAVSQQDYDIRKNAVAVTQAQIKAAKAAVQMARLNLDYCTIQSPVDGRAGQHLVDVGNIVKANDQPLLVLQRLDEIYADFTITERDLPLVRQHMAAGTLQAQVWVPGESAPPRQGNLTFLDTAVQPGAGTVKLRATLKNKDRHFWPGQFVNVRLVLQVLKNAVLVPQRAIQVGQTGRYVYVVTSNSLAELRPIVAGQRQGDSIVITQGVKAGENVVTVGQNAVVPGGPVHVLPPPKDIPQTQPAGVARS